MERPKPKQRYWKPKPKQPGDDQEELDDKIDSKMKGGQKNAYYDYDDDEAEDDDESDDIFIMPSNSRSAAKGQQQPDNSATKIEEEGAPQARQIQQTIVIENPVSSSVKIEEQSGIQQSGPESQQQIKVEVQDNSRRAALKAKLLAQENKQVHEVLKPNSD